jgi:hypothetical protein
VLAEMLSHEPIADDVAILCVERLASGDRHSA